jgi:hypothetical protein
MDALLSYMNKEKADEWLANIQYWRSRLYPGYFFALSSPDNEQGGQHCAGMTARQDKQGGYHVPK